MLYILRSQQSEYNQGTYTQNLPMNKVHAGYFWS